MGKFFQAFFKIADTSPLEARHWPSPRYHAPSKPPKESGGTRNTHTVGWGGLVHFIRFHSPERVPDNMSKYCPSHHNKLPIKCPDFGESGWLTNKVLYQFVIAAWHEICPNTVTCHFKQDTTRGKIIIL